MYLSLLAGAIVPDLLNLVTPLVTTSGDIVWLTRVFPSPPVVEANVIKFSYSFSD